MNSDNNDPNEFRHAAKVALRILVPVDVIWAMATFSDYPRSPDDWMFIAEGVMFPLFTVWFIVWTVVAARSGWGSRPMDEAVRLRQGGWYIFTFCLALLPSFISLDALNVMYWGEWRAEILSDCFTVGLLVLLCVSWGKIKKAAPLRSKAAQPTLLVLLRRHGESRTSTSVMVVNQPRYRRLPHRRH